MADDYEKGVRKVIDLTVQAEHLTSDILKSAAMDFLNNKAEKKGKITFSELEKRSSGKLENIEVTENNIGDFLETAKKYDIDYSVKRDKSTQPQIYHIFFSANKAEDFQRAFSEYAVKAVSEHKQPKRGEMSIEQVKAQAREMSSQTKKKEKERERAKENVR